jgi:hypothetical protein
MARLNTSVVVLSFITVLTSCLAIRPGAVKAGKNLYITYLAEKNTIYFIKPLDLFQQKGKGSTAVDLTFKYSNIIDDTASLKISIYDQEVLKQIDSICFEGQNAKTTSHAARHMFSDRANKQYISRFEIFVPLIVTKTLFDAQEWKITVFTNGLARVYISNRRTNNNIKRLKKSVFNVL